MYDGMIVLLCVFTWYTVWNTIPGPCHLFNYYHRILLILITSAGCLVKIKQQQINNNYIKHPAIIVLVSFPDPTTPLHMCTCTWGKGLGIDIGAADSWFCKLSNRVTILHRVVLVHVQSCDGAQGQENSLISPDPFLSSIEGRVWPGMR